MTNCTAIAHRISPSTRTTMVMPMRPSSLEISGVAQKDSMVTTAMAKMTPKPESRPDTPKRVASLAKITTVDLTKKAFTYSEQKSLLGVLKKKGFDLEPIYCGGKSAVDQQREQWTDGANAFALAPGVILLYERNVRTAEALARHGYHIVYEDDLLLGRTELETWTNKKYALQIAGNELSRARGGPRCMTMPLVREDI